MSITVDSTVKEIVRNAAAADIIEKYCPGFKADKRLKLAYSFTFRTIADFPEAHVSKEALAKIEEELKQLP
jgi:hypothetical protein